jgi:hypothetical protein
MVPKLLALQSVLVSALLEIFEGGTQNANLAEDLKANRKPRRRLTSPREGHRFAAVKPLLITRLHPVRGD